MLSLNPPLADIDATAIKAIFWVIALIIWGIGSLASALKNAAKKGQGLPMQRPLVTPAPVVRPPRATGAKPPTRVVLAALREQMSPSRPVAVSPPVRSPALPPAPPMPAHATLSDLNVAVNRTHLNPRPIRDLRNLLAPHKLQETWMLTEVLGKPLALRDDNGPRAI